MTDIESQIESIIDEIRKTPYHKGTEHYIGKLRAKLSKLRAKQIQKDSAKKGGGGGYAIKKQGDATVVLVGPPSAGKSTLLNKLTNAKSKVAPYAFTTLTVVPGMMDYRSAKIQILDVPGLIKGAEEGKGKGREVLSVVRGANLIILFAGVSQTDSFETIEKTLYENGVRANMSPPKVLVEKRLSGGSVVHSNLKQDVSDETIKEVAHEMGAKNAEIKITEKLTLERLIDAFSSNRVYIPMMKVVNKIDLKNKTISKDILEISAKEGVNLEKLRKAIWEQLKFIQIYLVRPDEDPSEKNPIIMKVDDKLLDVAQKIGSEFTEGKTRAKIWGEGAKFAGQEVSLSTKVKEGMQVRFV